MSLSTVTATRLLLERFQSMTGGVETLHAKKDQRPFRISAVILVQGTAGQLDTILATASRL